MSTVPTPTGRSRGLLITLISIGGAVLVLLIVLVAVLLRTNSTQSDTSAISTPTVSATPSSSASAAPSASASVAPAKTTAPQADTSTRFTSFNAVTQVKCDRNSDTKPLIQVSWATANAVSAWYTANAGDAANDQYMKIPLSGNQDAFTDEHLFDCFHRPSQAYTLTIVAPNGDHISKHWTVTNIGDQ